MSAKVYAIGALILVSFILTTVATFTKNWIVWSVAGLYHYGIGIVPYNSNEVTWFAAASWMMFISFGLFFPLILIYLHAAYKVHHHGCCHSIRHNFHGCTLILSVIVIMEAVAFILMAVNANNYGYGVSESIGSSAYLALSSGIVATVAMSLSGHVARRDCH
uniref:MARVEL domain-containing protein n=1 Tax=Caenorhabditis tropicalis TaxID=1561998 RepID=A0A1I7USM7_9PELO